MSSVTEQLLESIKAKLYDYLPLFPPLFFRYKLKPCDELVEHDIVQDNMYRILSRAPCLT